ncbi:hypothetical protein QYE76_072003 [Lolium multiflorum]|uniref:VQ domain-containing protein n=1 Tax=Lolium multiflorum TaxID=4521 RepID=A0AAD8QC22_LOLMU|nr:hypothetical protein QYE76_072003 [Lolium multiflorum]
MEHGGERRYGGHEQAQRAPARPMRGAVALPPAPPKVYRVEPRDFRELVQRLTGARAASASTAGPAMAAPAHHAAAPAQAHGRREPAATEQFDYSSWFSAPLLSPASMPPGMDGHHHGALL